MLGMVVIYIDTGWMSFLNLPITINTHSASGIGALYWWICLTAPTYLPAPTHRVVSCRVVYLSRDTPAFFLLITYSYLLSRDSARCYKHSILRTVYIFIACPPSPFQYLLYWLLRLFLSWKASVTLAVVCSMIFVPWYKTLKVITSLLRWIRRMWMDRRLALIG